MMIPKFRDENGNDLSFYDNDKGLLYMEIDNGNIEKSWVVLNREDVLEMIKKLKEFSNHLVE